LGKNEQKRWRREAVAGAEVVYSRNLESSLREEIDLPYGGRKEGNYADPNSRCMHHNFLGRINLANEIHGNSNRINLHNTFLLPTD
jgi:hypothetical protein